MTVWQRLFRKPDPETRRPEARLPEARLTDLDDEIAAHLAFAAADREANGADPSAARREAEHEFGNAALVKDITRETWGWLWPERLLQDLKYALRQFRKSPGFAATVIGTLALGIGAATAMFTVVDHVLLRPLPYAHAGGLLAIHEVGAQKKDIRWSPMWLDIDQWRRGAHLLEDIAFTGSLSGRNYLETKTASLQIRGVTVSSNLFSVLGVGPALGRTFVAEPAGFAPGKDADTIVLSDAIWKSAFAADPAILGKTVQVNAKTYTVIGVMPPGFEFPFNGSAHDVWTSPQVWVPLQLSEDDQTRSYTAWNYDVVARLRSGVSVKAAAAELNTLQKKIAAGYTEPTMREQRSEILLQPYADSLVDTDLRKALLALLAASGVLWLIASVNVTNLLLVRATTRRREIAMRGALGASRWRVTQQMVVEALVLSFAAAVVGIGIGLAAVRLSQSVIPIHLNVNMSTHVDIRILAVLCALTFVTAILSSAGPAWLAARAPIEPALKQGGRQSGSSRGQNRLRGLLVIAEIAMSLTLLVACGLLLRTIYSLRHVPLGFRTDHVIVANLDIPSWRYEGKNMSTDLYGPLVERVQHLPEVQAAGLMSEVPLGQTFNIRLSLQMNGNNITAALKAVSPQMQRILGFHMLAGRFFNEQDTATSEPVIVVNRAFARLYSPNRHDPAAVIGSKLLNIRKDTPARIVGVLDDERQKSIAESSQPEVEMCLPQIVPGTGFYQPTTIAMDLALRTTRPPASIIPDLRDILRQASPELANATITTMDQVVEDSYGSQRLAAHLLQIFGGSALFLCLAGLYGLLAYTVSQRTREMGVRIALGAQRGNVQWLVLCQAGVLILAGLVIGSALALASGRLIRSYLYGVTAHDAWTLSIASLLLLLGGMLAAYLPARRAAGVNPVEALRTE